MPTETSKLITRLNNSLRWRAVRLRNNHSIHKMAQQVAGQEPPSHGQPVAIFNASTRLGSMSLNAAYSLLVSWSLRLSSIPVVHFVCQAGMTRCIHGTNKSSPRQLPPCRECIAQSKVNFAGSTADFFTYKTDAIFEKEIASLSLAEMENFMYSAIPLGKICLSSLRWVMRRYHLIEDETTLILFRHFLRSAWNIARQFEVFLDRTQPRALLVFNGIVYPEAIARFLAERRGIRVVSHEVNMQPFSAYFSDQEATFRSTRLPDSFSLTRAQIDRFNDYFHKRTQGQFKMAGVNFWKDMKGLDESFLNHLAQFHQVVPVFSNVIFDTSQEHANVYFSHMFDWLDHILVTANQYPDTCFILRAHPDESRVGKASEESVADWVIRSGFDQLPNTVFIKPDQPLNSYELIVRSKFALIYTSTIGMESTLLGIAVLCAGKAYFNEYAPATYFPESRQRFNEMLVDFLNSTAPIKPPPEQQINARNFLYSQLFMTSLPFDEFLEEDGAWTGYVKMKNFAPKSLLPANSETMRVIQEGVLDGKPFMLPNL